MSEIKPKMVDGEARCDADCDSLMRVDSPQGKYLCRSSRMYQIKRGFCWPYYRAELEVMKRHRQYYFECTKDRTGVFDDTSSAIVNLREQCNAANALLREYQAGRLRPDIGEDEKEKCPQCNEQHGILKHRTNNRRVCIACDYHWLKGGGTW